MGFQRLCVIEHKTLLFLSEMSSEIMFDRVFGRTGTPGLRACIVGAN